MFDETLKVYIEPTLRIFATLTVGSIKMKSGLIAYWGFLLIFCVAVSPLDGCAIGHAGNMLMDERHMQY